MDQQEKDRDDTRRVLYIALASLDEGKPCSASTAGTLANALAHHSDLMTPVAARAFAGRLRAGDKTAADTVWQLLQHFSEEG